MLGWTLVCCWGVLEAAFAPNLKWVLEEYATWGCRSKVAGDPLYPQCVDAELGCHGLPGSWIDPSRLLKSYWIWGQERLMLGQGQG